MSALLLLVCLTPTPAGAAPDPWVGSYDLVLSLESGWHHHRLQLDSREPGAASGVVAIDRSLGPEARTPTPDERVHHLPFRASEDPGTGALTFTVVVGKQRPQTWRFELYPVEREGQHWLVGTVEVTAGETGRGRCGVLALPAGP